MTSRRSKGFTLVELMVTIAIVAILATIAFPSFRSTLRSNQVASASNEATGLVALARSEAIRNKRGGGVCGSTDGASCDGTWSKGMLAWADVDGDGGFTTGEVVLRFVTVSTALKVTGPTGTVIAFDAHGRRRAADAQELTLQPTSCDKQPLRRRLTINASGQLNSLKETCS